MLVNMSTSTRSNASRECKSRYPPNPPKRVDANGQISRPRHFRRALLSSSHFPTHSLRPPLSKAHTHPHLARLHFKSMCPSTLPLPNRCRSIWLTGIPTTPLSWVLLPLFFTLPAS